MFEAGFTWQGLGPTGGKVSIRGLTGLQPRLTLQLELTSADGKTRAVPVACRIDTLDELAYFQNGGILPYVLRRLAA